MNYATRLLIALLWWGCIGAASADPAPAPAPAPTAAQGVQAADAEPSALKAFGSDVGAYYTAPLHWRVKEWSWFAGTLAVIAASHHWDTNVRDHFTRDLPNSGIGTSNSHDLQDALPAAAAFVATWMGAEMLDDDGGRHETWMMFEAALLSSVTTEALKYTIRRQGPDETTDPDKWGAGGSSFPSLHTTAAFAIGTVLAESGGDDYRWVRRVLGYGIGGYTVYARLKHNAHWLSDTVAGSALGISTAQFVMHRAEGLPEVANGFSIVPVRGGVMLTYTVDPSKY
jgi:membrane-associated phospholipid phosphatase